MPETLNRLVIHPCHGLGVITFNAQTEAPYLRCVFLDAVEEGCPGYLKKLGVRYAEGRLELPVFPDQLNGHHAPSGLSVCEFAARRELGRQGRAVAA